MPIKRVRRNVKPRKRIARRTRYVRRRRPTTTTVRKLSRRVSRVTRNFAPEFKYIDTNLNTPPGEAASPNHFWMVEALATMGIPGEPNTSNVPVNGYLSTPIYAPVQGDGPHNRVGNQVLYRSIQITGLATILPDGQSVGTFTPAVINCSGYLKIMVVMDTQARAGSTTTPVPNLYQPDIDGLYSTASRKVPYSSLRYRPIATRWYSLSMGNKPSAPINIQIPMRRVMHFHGEDHDDVLNNCFHVIAFASPTLPTHNSYSVRPTFAVRLQARLRFVDC